MSCVVEGLGCGMTPPDIHKEAKALKLTPDPSSGDHRCSDRPAVMPNLGQGHAASFIAAGGTTFKDVELHSSRILTASRIHIDRYWCFLNFDFYHSFTY